MLRVKVSTYFWTTLRTAKKKVSLHFVHFHFQFIGRCFHLYPIYDVCSDLPVADLRWDAEVACGVKVTTFIKVVIKSFNVKCYPGPRPNDNSPRTRRYSPRQFFFFLKKKVSEQPERAEGINLNGITSN